MKLDQVLADKESACYKVGTCAYHIVRSGIVFGVDGHTSGGCILAASPLAFERLSPACQLSVASQRAKVSSKFYLKHRHHPL